MDQPRGRGVLRRALGISRALQVHLHLSATDDFPGLSRVLAACRVNRVVALARLAENSDLHLFEQVLILAFEFRRARRAYGKNRPVFFDFGKGDFAGLTLHAWRRWRRSLLVLAVADPAPLQVHAERDRHEREGHAG